MWVSYKILFIIRANISFDINANAIILKFLVVSVTIRR